MNPRRIISNFPFLFFLFLGTASDLHSQSRREDTSKNGPNIVVIMADDLGWMDLRCYGNDRLDTPALDQLAEEGMRFTNAYAAAAVCSPTRAAMMTGQSPARLRLTNHAPGHKDGFTLEGSDLAEASSVRQPSSWLPHHSRTTFRGRVCHGPHRKVASFYVARNSESGPLEPDLRPDKQGFDLNIGGCFRGGALLPILLRIKSRLSRNRKRANTFPNDLPRKRSSSSNRIREKRFYLNWWPYSVHYPIEAKKDLISKYEKRKGPGIKDPVYAAMIEGMDTEIGRFLKALDEAGLRENTLVLFKSDNGGYNGDNRPLRGFKGMLYEGGIRIPWIVRWPGKVEANSTCRTPVISTDCFPTFLEVVGLDPASDQPVDGESILPLLEQSGDWDRKALYFHYPNYAFHKRNRLGGVVREGKFKFILR